MSSLKISANVSEVKKSLLDLARDIKDLGKTKISIFSSEDKKFIKSELNDQISQMKAKIVENRNEISKLVAEQQKLQKGSKEELEYRKKIVDAYKNQTKLASEIKQVQGSGMAGFDIAGMLSKVGKGFALGALAFGATKTIQSGAQFARGAGNRVRLTGLGLENQGFGSPEELARAGLTEQQLIQRQVQTAARLGREGGSTKSILQQAKFERAYGLEEGSLMNTSGALRSSFGGKGADQAQMKLQASILASGIKDELAPYLEATTDLLADINKNGATNTDEMIRAFATMAKESGRTPEQIADAFKGINDAIKGSSGEQNAFYQTAFARAGIGGRKIGATKIAIESGGLFGLNPDELKAQGFNDKQIENMMKTGLADKEGGTKRSNAILEQLRKSGGLKKGERVGEVSDDRMYGMMQLTNEAFGTKGIGGIQAAKLLEQFTSKQISQKEFDKKYEEIQKGSDPQLQMLDKVNSTLAGQLTVQEAILENVMEGLGTKGGAKTRMIATEAEIQGTKGTANVVGAVDKTGALDATREGIKKTGEAAFGDYSGSSNFLYDAVNGSENYQNAMYVNRAKLLGKSASKKGNIPTTTSGGATMDPQHYQAIKDATKDGIKEGLASQKTQSIQNNNKVGITLKSSDGKVTKETPYKRK